VEGGLVEGGLLELLQKNLTSNKKPANRYQLRVLCSSLNIPDFMYGADDWTRTSTTCVTTPSR
jgi:hypothetical protein